ncbi:MerR family transcriptional regulator [Pantoea sp. LMR881]|uniref:MerR family transcriptional regulator n=1 Tax=Pantoea sp. LMR881 TaxID=3014336 RepID=UPI0022AF98D3|nr:MerR family transcriptional regulator [Pantoea sp. LMR881]MCZ4061117.1 MerR family transcriptional regulator [Pantoea sp. LMR881]
MFTSAFVACRMTDILPATLNAWQSASLITPPSGEGYSEPQMAQIRVIRALTSSGDTLSEIRTLLSDSWHYRPSGWEFRRQELIFQLVSGTDETRTHCLWELYTNYSPKDVITYLLRPLAGWLCGEDKHILRARGIKCLLSHTQRLLKTRQSAEHIKPLLKIMKLLKPSPSPAACHRPSVNSGTLASVNRSRNTSLVH